ncbi:MAG: hypothetical protein U9Q62_07955 [Campylobacterota bacterium]|nr:hypothetical protein [Campylobacterota bacterium]
MKKIALGILLSAQMSFGLDFVFSGGFSNSPIGSSKIGFGMSFGDYQSKYKSGLSLGWNIGYSTMGSGEPDRYYGDSTIISVPSERDWLISAELRPLFRFGVRNEIYLIFGGVYNVINSDDYAMGYSYGAGYQYLIDKNVFVGGNARVGGMTYNSGSKDTEDLDSRNYDLYSATIYVGFRF